LSLVQEKGIENSETLVSGIENSETLVSGIENSETLVSGIENSDTSGPYPLHRRCTGL
jgi:hypothetical protein